MLGGYAACTLNIKDDLAGDHGYSGRAADLRMCAVGRKHKPSHHEPLGVLC